MGFKIVEKGKSAYYCDICNKETSIEYMAITRLQTTFGTKEYILCKKHRSIFKEWIKKQTEKKC